MDNVLNNVVISIIFGFIGILLLVFGYWFFDKVLTKLDFNQELKEKNVAMAIVIAGFMIALGIIISGVVS
jgi:putative membrane protein